jgi:hypothetical protein
MVDYAGDVFFRRNAKNGIFAVFGHLKMRLACKWIWFVRDAGDLVFL